MDTIGCALPLPGPECRTMPVDIRPPDGDVWREILRAYGASGGPD